MLDVFFAQRAEEGKPVQLVHQKAAAFQIGGFLHGDVSGMLVHGAGEGKTCLPHSVYFIS